MNEPKSKKVVVKDDEIELSSDVVRELADGVRKMRLRAKDKLIVLLLNDVTGIARRDIQVVLDAIPNLERIYFKAKP